jgi:hypothetical protein
MVASTSRSADFLSVIPKKPASNRVRVRRTIANMWVWELVMPDGHVVQQSEPFEDRANCEKAARKEGLPVDGMSRPRPTDDG